MSRRPRKLALPVAPEAVEITALSHDGRGVGRVEGKTVFVSGALPGEVVRVRYRQAHRRFDEADAVEVLQPSPLRVEPGCPHFGVCGGCSLQHLEPGAQIQFKQDALLEQLEHLGQVRPEEILPPLTGPVWGYRQRARLGVKYVEKKTSLLVGFRERGGPFLTDMGVCKVLHPSVGERISELRGLIGGLRGARVIVQVEMAVGDDHTALILRNMEALEEADLAVLRAYAETSGLHLYLQPGGLDSVAPLHPIPAAPLYYSLPEEGVRLQFEPTDFTQVNQDLNRQMLARAMNLLQPQSDERVLELFCGLGNFTLPLARRAAHVTAVEGDAGLLQRADANAQRHGLRNIGYHVANLANLALEADWLRQSYPKILLDPPRSGALEIIQQLDFRATRRIVYVSCNPATLARDAGELVNRHGFRLLQVGVMDMFPHTAHVESIAVLVK